jgi:hypothetical protein
MRRVSRKLVTTLFAVAVPALGAAGCGVDPVDFTPAPAPSVQISEGFSGTVSVGGGATFNFAALGAGNVTAGLKTITPASNAVLGLALGTWNGSACQIIIANDAANTTLIITGATTAAGNLCVRAYDVGKLTATQTVEITVTHF